ncbi:acyl-CoA ligase (AMP-forming), exosortase A system-associated [Deferrisoma camini]|uniref:acyl-CoA ligase (AMP-forming), exosortase A system-associated n=1 Tax=Deferrisoma camini TaxID=1035120 RepID=UPI00046CF7F1
MRITVADSLREQAGIWPDKEALVHRQRRISYASLDAEVDRLACLLLDQGLRKGDRVAVYMEKSPEEAASLLAAARAGGVFIDVNHLLKPPQVEHILCDSGARVLLTTRQRAAGLAEVLARCPDLEVLILHGPGETPEIQRLRVVERGCWGEEGCGQARFPRVVETDIGAIIYTSGSTGKPKGVVLSHRNLVAGAESVFTYVENTPDDRILSVLPFSFDYGLNQLTCSLHVGCTCVLINYLFPNDILKALEAENITGLGLIPPLWLQLLKLEWDHTRFPHWRYLTNTGGAMPVHATRELRRRLPHTRIYLMYGLTEAFRGTYLPPEEVDRRPTSIGKAIPNAEIWVLNDRGEHCKPGEEGELVQRGAHVALGYWNDPDKTAERFRPNPFAPPGLQMQEMVVFSGDRVKTDEEGYIYFVERADEMIKTSGYRVSPTEVEDALYATGLVEHAVAFGVPDEVLGQVVAAVVSAKKPGVQPRDLTAACAQTLPNYMVPKHIEVWERLPLNPNGKIDRNAVKRDFLNRGGAEDAENS